MITIESDSTPPPQLKSITGCKILHGVSSFGGPGWAEIHFTLDDKGEAENWIRWLRARLENETDLAIAAQHAVSHKDGR